MLTGRHSGSFESTWEADIRYINELGADKYLVQIEESELGDGFWQVALPRALETTSTNSPYFQTFLAAQVVLGAKGFLSDKLTVAAMIQQSGDIHHLFPKEFLKESHYPDRKDYNQVANYAKTDTAINIHIGKRSPENYMQQVERQIESGKLTLGDISNQETLDVNLTANAIPINFASYGAADYPVFLEERRKLMAQTIRQFYEQL